jgi:protein tyrosine phosphatase (PTP) superfamily phosphohydrolase (DUF442 family)
MHNRLLLFSFFLYVVIGFGGCSSQPQSPLLLPQPALDRALRIDRVIISGQPTELEIRSFPQRGVTRVVNVRSPEEMNDVTQVNFDETKLLQELNIAYDNLPISGDKYPYRPEVLEAFAKIMQTSKDTVLLHCKVGGRARWLYAAYEIKYLNKSTDEVMRSLERYGFWPLPIEKLIGTPMRIDKKE